MLTIHLKSLNYPTNIGCRGKVSLCKTKQIENIIIWKTCKQFSFSLVINPYKNILCQSCRIEKDKELGLLLCFWIRVKIKFLNKDITPKPCTLRHCVVNYFVCENKHVLNFINTPFCVPLWLSTTIKVG